ncbi:hypothetical protein Ae201684P_005327 [Aphanomyces euteiches]|nr:hypothetical protein Ae201684P_005327 [Aphanomyces euteiches]
MPGLAGVVGSSCISTKAIRRRKLTAREKLLLAQGSTHSTVLDVLSRKLRAKLEELIPVENERHEKAFRLFTTTDAITPQSFHALLIKFRVAANRQQSYALFNAYDVDCRGTLDRSKFLHGVFQVGTIRRKPPLQQPAQPAVMPTTEPPTPQKRVMTNRAPPPHKETNNPEPAVPQQRAPVIKPNFGVVTDRIAHKPMLTHHHPAREQHETPLGENLPFEEIVKRIREKIDQRTSKASDRFRQAFKIFKKASGITSEEFHEGLLQLGFRLTQEQNTLLFSAFDSNHSGDLDLNEFVQGISLDDSSIKFINATLERQRREEARRKRYQLAVESVEQAWTIEDMERKLREKIEQHTSKSSDCFRQAFKIFKKSCGIRRQEFHEALAELGLDLKREHTDKLFAKYDIDGSGDIDLPEFVRGVLPADYTGGTWVAEADEMHRLEAERKKLQPDSYLNRVDITDWSLDTIQMKVREKITQKTTRSSDTYRQVYKIFQKTSGITLVEFRRAMLILGFRLNDAQARGLFSRYDTDHSNTIDLSEFCRHVLPPDYNGDGDHWGHTQEEHRQKAKDAIAYVTLTKNGTVPIPTPPLFRHDETPRPSSAPPARPSSSQSTSPRKLIQPASGSEISPSKPVQVARPASARPASSQSRPPTPRPTSARPKSSASTSTASSDRRRPTSARSCSSSSSVAIHENPFKSKRRHFFHHHSLWQRKVRFLREQQQKEANNPSADGTSKPNEPEKGVDDDDQFILDDDDDDEIDDEEEETPYEELRTPVRPRPASARPSSAKMPSKSPQRPPSARTVRPPTAASTASIEGSTTTASPRARRMSDTSSQVSSNSSTSSSSRHQVGGVVHRAKFKPRVYGPGFKKMFLQMAKDKMWQQHKQ